MSYCRFSSHIPELAPNVDLSFNKMKEILLQEPIKYSRWMDYLEKNNVPLSDAYVYKHVGNYFICHWKNGKEDFLCETAGEMTEYLQECKDEGALVPQYAIDALIEESNYD